MSDEEDQKRLDKIIRFFDGIGFDPNTIAAYQVKLGKEWAEAKYQAHILEESKKTMLSEIKIEKTGSDKNREMLALADHRYKKHIEAMCHAKHECHEKEIKYLGFCSWLELKRTEQANLREEMRMSKLA